MTIQCAWHVQNFPKESNVMQQDRAVIDEHGNRYEPLVSHSICAPCMEIFEAKEK